MDVQTIFSRQNCLITWTILFLVHPTQTTLFNEIFWKSKSVVHTGAIEIPYHVIHTSEGNVDSGNYTFYTLKQPGTLRLVLTPLAGDPDLYVSEGGSSNPSFMPEDFAISSASCGDEQIDIKSSFKRPINIAVYGHPFYEISRYNLEVLLAEFEETDHFTIRDNDEYDNHNREGSESSYKDYDAAMSWVSLTWNIIRSILEILIEVMM